MLRKREFQDIDFNRFSIELGPLAKSFQRRLLEVHRLQIERSIYFVSPTVQQKWDSKMLLFICIWTQLLGLFQLLQEDSNYSPSRCCVFPIVYAIMEKKT